MRLKTETESSSCCFRPLIISTRPLAASNDKERSHCASVVASSSVQSSSNRRVVVSVVNPSTPPLSFTPAAICQHSLLILCQQLEQLRLPCFIEFGKKWDIHFNPAKTQCVSFGGSDPKHFTPVIDAKCLSWCPKLKYLGCIFKRGVVR